MEGLELNIKNHKNLKCALLFGTIVHTVHFHSAIISNDSTQAEPSLSFTQVSISFTIFVRYWL